MQYINLYQEQFKPQRKIPWMMILTGALLLLFVIMAGLNWYQQRTLGQLQSRVQREESQQQQLMATLDLLQQKLSLRKSSSLLKQQVQTLRGQLKQRQPLRLALDRAMAQENTIPASLEGLAVKPLRQLWFTHIVLSSGGTNMRLQGLALQPDNVPSLIEGLAGQQIFAQHQFGRLQLDRQDSGLYQFVLSTEMEGQ
ncbi:MAG: hypothetical protein U9R29_03415 [Thermodesulfobacteriota bacterium]|nr:hypothetical protein [Thermodesulfobacteriota bacterium]